MSDSTKNGQAVTPDNVHITDAPAQAAGPVNPDNVHITDAS
jgi:2'-5' RNA ligase